MPLYKSTVDFDTKFFCAKKFKNANFFKIKNSSKFFLWKNTTLSATPTTQTTHTLLQTMSYLSWLT